MRVDDPLVYAGYRAAAALSRALPAPVARHAHRPLGRLAAATSPRQALLRSHLRRVVGPELSDRQVDELVAEAFGSYARYWIEVFRLAGSSSRYLEDHVYCEGVNNVDDALTAGNGAILALPHLGNWDFSGAWLASRGYPLSVVVEVLRPAPLFRWFVAAREKFGMHVIPADDNAGAEVANALRANQIVALLSDRDITGTGIEVEFFGERTRLPAGPVTMALRTGAALLPTACYFDGLRSHRPDIGAPIPLEREGRLREDLSRLNQLLARRLESLIVTAPSQWHLFQPNWPSDEGYRRDR